VINWSRLPDVGAVALLTCAFASVAQHNHTPVSRLWLTAWVMIVLHFLAFMFLDTPGICGSLALFIGISTLVWAGMLFMWSAVPYRKQHFSQWIVAAQMLSGTLYIGLLIAGAQVAWALTLTAILIGVLPLALSLYLIRSFNHPLRWTMTALYGFLSVSLLILQHRPANGANLSLNAILFTVYFGCSIHFLYVHRRGTAGAFITIAGFLAWASVFVVSPGIEAFFPNVHLENEVWNLPKYIVAFGMILLLLENQIEHNKYLALHDELTGLPNRRLFLDRLASALERARRTKAQAALLVVDLDHFKQVNDTLGHHVGDLLLQHVSTVFAGRVRRSDTVARTGGDEFSLILEEPTSRAAANLVGESLMQLLNDPIQIGSHQAQVGASVGIAVFPDDAQDLESLCIAADLRMYDDKHGAADNAAPVDSSIQGALPADPA